MEDAVIVDEAGRGFEEVEEDGVGLAAEEHEVEDLDKGWEPHCAGYWSDFVLGNGKTVVGEVRSSKRSLILLTCDDGDIRGYSMLGMSQIGGTGSSPVNPTTRRTRKLTMPRTTSKWNVT